MIRDGQDPTTEHQLILDQQWYEVGVNQLREQVIAALGTEAGPVFDVIWPSFHDETPRATTTALEDQVYWCLDAWSARCHDLDRPYNTEEQIDWGDYGM